MILICYDGSEDAKAAIQHGGELLKGQAATVLSVWQPVSIAASRAPTAFAFLPSLLDAETIDQANADDAQSHAEEGAELARKAGVDAQPLTRAQSSTVARAILAEAEALDADAILMGSRGRTGVKSLLLGSVSHAVSQHADRPVIVVPSPNVARSRRQLRSLAGDEEQAEKRS